MDCGGGMTGAAAGDGGAKELMCRKDRPAEGTARAGTCGCWLEVGGDMPPATGKGRRSPSKNPPPALPVAEPNGLKLSDGGRTDKTKRTRVPPAVRWSAWLGSPPTEGLWTSGTEDVDSGGGMRALPPGRHERRNRLAARMDGPTERPERKPTGAGSKSEPACHQQRERGPTRPRQTPAERLLA